jgi:dihydroorotate dehydrogenase (NAD+) catalytic subunit
VSPLADRDFYRAPFDFAGKRIRGRFVIPSGIRCTHASVIARTFAEIPPVGVVTTKSISVGPRAGYREPIYARFSPASYINAVGLANPGAQAFYEELKSIVIPPEKFLLVSIFGGDAPEFAEAARILAPVADGFELNMSCPHAAGYGIEIGQDIDLVSQITAEVVRTSGRPVFVKLSAVVPRLGQSAQAALAAGAAGITVSNTVGPSTVPLGTEGPILSNRVGGLSGAAIRPLALRSVENVRAAIGGQPLLIGMGGIGSAEHVAQFRQAGADVFGIGSALTGLNTASVMELFSALERDLTEPSSAPPGADSGDTPLSMQYHPCVVTGKSCYSDQLFKLTLDRLPGNPGPGDLSGQFYFLFVPGRGEKPFAVFDAAERSIVIKVVGSFTQYLSTLPVGTRVFLRGPYGAHFAGVPGCTHYVLVGGGTGIASLPEIGHCLRRNNSSVQFVLGARSGCEIFEVECLRRIGPVSIATDDGSAGYYGTSSDLLRTMLPELAARHSRSLAFVNCGPAPMIYTCAALEKDHVSPERIISAIEYLTSCGVGICGKCASPDGHLSCIDGPFLPWPAFAS